MNGDTVVAEVDYISHENSAVVEVDHDHLGTVDEQVREPHIGVDQPEPIGAPAESLESRLDRRVERLELAAFLRTDPEAVLPRTPVTVAADRTVVVPARPRESWRPLPSADVAVHPRAEIAPSVSNCPPAASHVVEIDDGPVEPLEHHRVAFLNSGRLSEHDPRAVLRVHRSAAVSHDAVAAERVDPVEL